MTVRNQGLEFLLHFFYVVVLALTLVPTKGYAETLKVNESLGMTDVTAHIEYAISPENSLELPPTEGWSTFQNSEIKLGFDQQSHWFRFTIQNTEVNPTSLYLEIANPLLDDLYIYFVQNGKVESVQQLGDNQAFNARAVLHETFIIPLSLLPQQQKEVYFAVRSTGLLNFPVRLWQKELFQEQQNYQRLISGVLIGLVLAAVFGCLMLAIHRRQLVPLLDAGLLLSILLITLTLNGLAFHYLWPEFSVLQQHAIYLFTCFAIFCSAVLAVFTLQHVDDEHTYLLINGFKGMAVGALVLLPLTLLLNYQVALYFITGLAMLICICHITTGIWSWRHGHHEEQELNLGLFVLLFVLFMISLNNFTSLSLPLDNLQLLQSCLILLVFFVAFSLLNEQEEETVTDTASFSGPSNHEEELQQALTNQNFELQVTLRELQERNQELEKLNTLDALSGIHNRRHFDKRILAELRRARRELTPLSLIMFDIDHFKSVNDNYGHIAGDEVIRSVAHIASQQLNRSADEAFRYGGEEFALILPNTEAKGAIKIAETVREAIEKLIINTNSSTITCTVSLGVASSNSQQALTPVEFIEQADTALYQAKQAGRNQVKVYQSQE